MTSPPAMVATEPQVWRLVLSFMNFTEPSRKPTFTPPGWYELAPIMPRSGKSGVLPVLSPLNWHASPFGGIMWV